MNKKICLITTNENKFLEYKKIFSRYGYEVIRQVEEGMKVAAFIVDESNIYLSSGEELNDNSEGMAVNKCVVTATMEDNVRTFVGIVEGKVIPKKNETDNVFGWDDRFIPFHLEKSLHEMKEIGVKCSARDFALSQFISYLDFKKDYNLNFSNVKLEGNVDLSYKSSLVKFISNNDYINSLSEDSVSKRWIKISVNNGIFFRLKTNSRNGNYWNPGLAGIPFTPKKDPIHEISYLVHDIMHHLMPDHPYDGSTSKAAKNVYLVSRMMSEAFSLVMADMFFIKDLKEAGFSYDWSKRCIYPLYEDLSARGYGLKDLLWAVTKFVITGEYDHIPESEARTNFVEKYTPFFASDWRWTQANWEALLQRQNASKKWIEMVGGESVFLNLGLVPLGVAVRECGVTDESSIEETLDKVFSYHVSRVINPEETGGCDSIGNSIRRWALGQSAAYARYYPVVKTTAGLKSLLKIIKNPFASESDGVIARTIFDNYLETLQDFSAISPDDFRLFREVFPHYDPFFVQYKDETMTVKQAINNAWGV